MSGREIVAVGIWFCFGCGGDGEHGSATMSALTTSLTDPGSGDGPNDTTQAPTSGATTGPSGGTETTDTGSSESGDDTTGPVGEPGQVRIDFDEWGMSQPVITDQYPDAIFASEDKCAAIVGPGGGQFNTSAPNVLYLSSKTDHSCLSYANLYIDFPSPVYDLSFRAIVFSNGVAGRVRVFQLGVETALVEVIGVGDHTTPVPIDLGIYPGITRIEVVDTEELGDNPSMLYDDFTFTVYH